MSRAKKIQDLSDPSDVVQTSLFLDPSVNGSEKFFPPIYRDQSGWMKVFNAAQAEGRIGLDFEFSPKTHKPTVIGIASREMCAAIPCTDTLIQLVAECPARLVGHSVLGGHADRYVVAKAGFPTPIEKWDDSMIRHYICNQDFCAAPGKDEDDDDQGALGLMNLWSAAAMATMLPQWKECRGSACSGPCPRHDVLGYCAVDAWAGLAVADECTRLMKARGIPEELYADLARLTEMCGDMQAKGVKVDRAAVKVMEGKMKEHKKVLFPFEKVKGKKRYGVYEVQTPMVSGKEDADDGGGPSLLPQFKPGNFNPNAPADYLGYFKSHGINIKGKGNKAAGDKAAVIKALDKALRPLGLEYDPKNNVLKGGSAAEDTSLPPVLFELYKLAQYKGAGKGLKSWFDDKYFDPDGFIHPRFIVTATSTGRLASSSPNFQNIPARGFGSDVRRVIVPRRDDLCILKADFSQLELRVCLWYAGWVTGNYENPGKDAFTWLVEQSQGKFDKSAEAYGGKPRDIAKSVSHAGDYGEGFTVLISEEIRTARRQAEIKAGALLLFDGVYGPEWRYAGGFVAFTGANLAERLFKDKSYTARKKALEIQEIYFHRFPQIREWHRWITKQIDEKGYIQSYTGRYLELYGSAEDNFKLAAAFLGQGGGADYAQEKMLLFDDMGQIPMMQVHDEFVFEVPLVWSDEQCLNFMRPMVGESRKFPKFSCPAEVSRGLNWQKESEGNPNGLKSLGKISYV